MSKHRIRTGPAKLIEAWLHYGDLDHRPLQTVKFTGSKAKLRRLVQEARRDKWPLKIQYPDFTFIYASPRKR